MIPIRITIGNTYPLITKANFLKTQIVIKWYSISVDNFSRIWFKIMKIIFQENQYFQILVLQEGTKYEFLNVFYFLIIFLLISFWKYISWIL
jgi:hypothetical protein